MVLSLMPTTLANPDPLTLVGLERAHLRDAVYRRVFGATPEPLRVGRYTILERVGSGSMGAVFKAFDNQLDRLVAVKVLSAASTAANDRESLIREAKALARLSHPNVLAVYEVGRSEGGELFLATEFVKGWTLRGWVKAEHRSAKSIVDVVLQAAAGLHAAHQEGLVHRDIKPANILVGADGRVRIADFGLARPQPSPQGGPLDPRDVRQTTAAGTPAYMAPELLQGHAATALSDQFALCVTLFEMLFDALPTGGATARTSTVEARRRPGIPASALPAIERGLSEDPERRHESIERLTAAIRAPARAWWQRRTTRVLGAVSVATAALGTAAVVGIAPPVAAPTDTLDPVLLLEAERLVNHDPAAALEVLRTLPNPDDADRPEVRRLVEQAAFLGPAELELRLPDTAKSPLLMGGHLNYLDGDRARVVDLGDPTPRAREVGTAIEELESLVGPMYGRGSIVVATATPRPSWLSLALETEHTWLRRQANERMRHKLALSADGEHAAAIERPGDSNDLVQTRVTVRDTTTGDVRWSSGENLGGVPSVALNDDGSLLAWAQDDDNTMLLELATGTLREIPMSARRVQFVPGSSSLILVGAPGGLYRYDADTEVMAPLGNRNTYYQRIALSEDGRWLAAQDRNEFYVQELHGSRSHELTAQFLQFSPSGRYALIQREHEVDVVDLLTSDRQRLSSPSSIDSLSFVRSDEYVAGVGADGIVRRWRLDAPVTLSGHGAPLHTFAFSADAKTLYSTGHDYQLRRANLETGVSAVVTKLDREVHTLRVAPDETWVYLSNHSRSNVLHLDDVERPHDVPHSRVPVLVDETGKLLGIDDSGTLWSYDVGEDDIETLHDDLGECQSLAYHPQTGNLAAACSKGQHEELLVWTADGSHAIPLAEFGWRTKLHFWPDANHIVELGEEQRLYDLRDDLSWPRSIGRELESPPGQRVALTDGHWFQRTATPPGATELATTTKRGLRIFRDPIEPPIEILTPDPRMVALSADARRIAYSIDGETIIVRTRPLSIDPDSVTEFLSTHGTRQVQL